MSESKSNQDNGQVNTLVMKHAIDLLKKVCQVKEYQNKPSIANQGQCLDGYSALANYNGLADKIKVFLDKHAL